MTTTSILLNVIMSLVVLAGLAAGALALLRAWPDADDGRAFGRGRPTP